MCNFAYFLTFVIFFLTSDIVSGCTSFIFPEVRAHPVDIPQVIYHYLIIGHVGNSVYPVYYILHCY